MVVLSVDWVAGAEWKWTCWEALALGQPTDVAVGWPRWRQGLEGKGGREGTLAVF